MLDKILNFIGCFMSNIKVEEINSTNTFKGTSGYTPLTKTIKKGLYVVQAYTYFTSSFNDVNCNAKLMEGSTTVALGKSSLHAGGGQTLTALIDVKSDTTLKYNLYVYTDNNVTAITKIRILRIK